ncbi:YraN family protein [Castellaniella hirudinis]|uniref:YraN family protein n=1 Tax=Castellaniella hirudinis TaxID=1144617 RepID=UPI0039C12E8E
MATTPQDTAYDRAQAAQAQAHDRRRRGGRQATARQSRRHAGQPLAPGSPSQRQGHAAETRACAHLESHGARILARNLHCRAGEIDIVARWRDTLLFIEVRQRRHMRYGGAVASVNRTKQARLIRAAQYFLPFIARHHFAGRIPPCRFDVIGLQAGEIQWIADAFRT